MIQSSFLSAKRCQVEWTFYHQNYDCIWNEKISSNKTLDKIMRCWYEFMIHPHFSFQKIYIFLYRPTKSFRSLLASRLLIPKNLQSSGIEKWSNRIVFGRFINQDKSIDKFETMQIMASGYKKLFVSSEWDLYFGTCYLCRLWEEEEFSVAKYTPNFHIQLSSIFKSLS